MNKFAVVEFLKDQTVAIVRESWIENCDRDLYCYWPSKNAKNKVIQDDLPDKEKWRRYKVRVFMYTSDYGQAKKYLKIAEETSNMEESESPPKRKRVPCARFQENSDSEMDGEESDCSLNPTKKKNEHRESQQSLSLPKPPEFLSNSKVAPEQNKNDTTRPRTMSSTLPGATSNSCSNARMLSNLFPTDSLELSIVENMVDQRLKDVHLIILSILLCVLDLPDLQSMLPDDFGRGFTASSYMTSRPSSFATNDDNLQNRTPNSTPKSSGRGLAETIGASERQASSPAVQNFQRSVLVKLDAMLANQQEALSLLRKLVGASKSPGGGELLEDVIRKQMDSTDDLQAVCNKLNEDDSFKAKMVKVLSALSGQNVGDTTRRIMAKLGSNKLWSQYSMKGRKGKLAFDKLSLCGVIKTDYGQAKKYLKIAEETSNMEESESPPKRKRVPCARFQENSDSEMGKKKINQESFTITLSVVRTNDSGRIV
ncbi:Hypothetical predicted protein [Paramuricea clavata]|uniref:Uncharacterized protein n=1 Tax=Paramuricea clavata TaxID=317549 RepID=A0A7D9D5U9_PARCT|nr:Hypothetical predicted protein [Paramuricea clavata]